MKMINIVSIIILMVTARTHVLAVTPSDSTELNNICGLFKKCDSSLVFSAMLKSEIGRHLFSEKKYSTNISDGTNQIFFSKKHNKADFENNLYADFDLLSPSQKSQIVSVTKSWCLNNRITDSILIKYDANLEQVLYEIPKTKPLFKKYLTNRHQSWESLSIWQVEDLFERFMDYLYSLNNSELHLFYEEFSKTAKKLGPVK